MEHRLPENHQCSNAPTRTPLGPWYAKKTPEPKPEEMKVLIPERTKRKKRVASEGELHFIKAETANSQMEVQKPHPKKDKKAVTVTATLALVCGIVLSIIGIPFSVVYQSTTVPFLGEYQLHSITFLGSPIYTWSTWNAVVGPIEFFIAFILNTLACFILFLIIQSFVSR